MTTNLYFDDSLLLEFDANVASVRTIGDRLAIELDRSAFYPESGGQLADRGRIDECDVIDVQVDDSGTVLHYVASRLAALAVGQGVRCSVDGARRRRQMAMHTGQHMLSRALVDVAGAETVSSRLGEAFCTIDTGLSGLDESALHRAETLVNDVIDADVTVRAWFPPEAELAVLSLRRKPKVSEKVRVVSIEGFDVSPCGGTHCLRTAQVGLVHVLASERHKGGTRVTFSAGASGRELLAQDSRLLRAMARELSCGPNDVPGAIERLRASWVESREEVGRARARLAELLAREWIESSATGEQPSLVSGHLGDATADDVRAACAQITRDPKCVALVGARTDGGTHVMIARGSESHFDCGACMRSVASSAGLRGGGRPERAEGRMAADTPWETLVALVRGAMRDAQT